MVVQKSNWYLLRCKGVKKRIFAVSRNISCFWPIFGVRITIHHSCHRIIVSLPDCNCYHIFALWLNYIDSQSSLLEAHIYIFRWTWQNTTARYNLVEFITQQKLYSLPHQFLLVTFIIFRYHLMYQVLAIIRRWPLISKGKEGYCPGP